MKRSQCTGGHGLEPVRRSGTGTGIVWVAAVLLVGLVSAFGHLAWTEKGDEGSGGPVEGSAKVGAALGLFGWLGVHSFRGSSARADELALAPGAKTARFDFEPAGLEGWRSVDGQWAVEEMAGAPSGKRVLVQRAQQNAFNAIVAPGGPTAMSMCQPASNPFQGGRTRLAASCSASWTVATMSSGPMPSRTTFGSTTTIEAGDSSLARPSSPPRLVSGTRCVSWQSATASRATSIARSCWTIGILGLVPARSVSGQRLIPSLPSMTSPSRVSRTADDPQRHDQVSREVKEKRS
jgi:hypothetical protein